MRRSMFAAVCLVSLLLMASCGKKETDNRKEVKIDDVQKLLAEYHGLKDGDYKVIEETKTTPPNEMFSESGNEFKVYTIEIKGQEYRFGRYEDLFAIDESMKLPECIWYSDYYAPEFSARIAEVMKASSLNEEYFPGYSDYKVSCSVLPLWVGEDEVERIRKGEADRERWANELVMICAGIKLEVTVPEPVKLSEEDIAKIREEWFFLNEIDVTYNGQKTEYFIRLVQ